MNIVNIFNIAVAWAHLISATAWVGGSIFWLIVLTPSIQKIPSNHKTEILRSISHEFKSSEIFQASDMMVDALTKLLDKERVLAISKSDLVEKSKLESELKKIKIDIPKILISSINYFGIEELKEQIWKKINIKK